DRGPHRSLFYRGIRPHQVSADRATRGLRPHRRRRPAAGTVNEDHQLRLAPSFCTGRLSTPIVPQPETYRSPSCTAGIAGVKGRPSSGRNPTSTGTCRLVSCCFVGGTVREI